jgi:hypothetical protein
MYDIFLSLNNIEKFCMFHVNLSSIIFLLGWFFETLVQEDLYLRRSQLLYLNDVRMNEVQFTYMPQNRRGCIPNVLPFHMFVFGKGTSLNLEFPCISDPIYYRWGDYGWQQVLTMIHTYSTTLIEEDLPMFIHQQSTERSCKFETTIFRKLQW